MDLTGMRVKTVTVCVRRSVLSFITDRKQITGSTDKKQIPVLWIILKMSEEIENSRKQGFRN